MGFFMKEKLRALSFFLGLDVPYFVSGGFWITISLIVTTIGGIILSALFARIWSKEVFGQYSFLMAALGEPSLREVIAYPMTAGGQTAVMDAPSEAGEEQLKELEIIDETTTSSPSLKEETSILSPTFTSKGVLSGLENSFKYLKFPKSFKCPFIGLFIFFSFFSP